MIRGLAASLVAALLAAGSASAQTVKPAPDLDGTSLEDLMKIRITSVARKDQRVADVPAAVYVLTAADIRRSGMRTLPELLRLVPGVQIAQITSSNWAVSIRGFNDQFSNKLLVLIDGRSIYGRAFSGVFWDASDVLVDDIERIEVIRGPGAAIWGANAVNGIINVVTKEAKASPGVLVRLTGGTFDPMQGTVRYGGTLGATAAYRVYSQWSAHGASRLDNRAGAGDAWRTSTSGLRVDWTRGRQDWTVDTSLRSGDGHTVWRFPGGLTPDLDPRTDVVSSFRAGSVLGRWTHRADDGSTWQAQSSAGLTRREDLVQLDETTVDADVQYHGKLGRRQDIVAGGGYRFVRTTPGENFAVAFAGGSQDTMVTNLFLQDEVRLGPVALTVGSKLEHDTYSGWSLQPTARVLWSPSRQQRVWAGISRALRTPSLHDRALRFRAVVLPNTTGLPVVAGVVGNPNYQAEVFVDAEAGYRLEVGSRASLDVTAFRGRYTGLPASTQLAPAFETSPQPHLFIATRQENRVKADTSGVELAVRLAPVSSWTIDASYSRFRLTPHDDSAGAPAAVLRGSAPASQWQVRSGVRLGRRTEVDGALFYTGALRTLGVPAYTRADLRAEFKLTSYLSIVGAGRNLFAAEHAEYTSSIIVARRIPRSYDAQLVWKF